MTRTTQLLPILIIPAAPPIATNPLAIVDTLTPLNSPELELTPLTPLPKSPTRRIHDLLVETKTFSDAVERGGFHPGEAKASPQARSLKLKPSSERLLLVALS